MPLGAFVSPARFLPWFTARAQETVAVAVDPKVITRILHSDSGHNTIFDLNVEGSGAVKAMIVDWQNEPIKGKLLHIDLKRIAMDKAMRVSVPIQLVGIPIGVKSRGGILEHVLREVEIECLPGDIPSHLDVDVSNLELHGLIHVSDLPHSGSIKFLADENATVAHVTIIKEEVVAVEEVAAAPTEPEVAKKGKTDVPLHLLLPLLRLLMQRMRRRSSFARPAGSFEIRRPLEFGWRGNAA